MRSDSNKQTNIKEKTGAKACVVHYRASYNKGSYRRKERKQKCCWQYCRCYVMSEKEMNEKGGGEN